jgi:hypothetical protein
MKVSLLMGAAFTALASASAAANDFSTLELAPGDVDFSGLNLKVGGDARTTFFVADQPSAPGGIGKTKIEDPRYALNGTAEINAALTHDFGSGFKLSLKSSFFLHSSRLTNDDYGNNFVQKAFVQFATDYGTLEMGMTDGAAAATAITGPVVNRETALDNSQDTFFTDTSGDAFTKNLKIETLSRTTYNYAKFSYYSPRVYGLQFGVSYTPAPNRDPFPYAARANKINNLDVSFWEAGINYMENFGPFLVGLYGSGDFAEDSRGRDETNHLGLTDWMFGGSVTYQIDDNQKLSAGGSFHRKNSYVFAIENFMLTKNETTSMHVGAKYETGPWAFGAEYGDGMNTGSKFDYSIYSGAMDPTVGVRGYGAAVSYRLNRNLSAVLGWQELRYGGTENFYTGAQKIHMDAAYLQLKLSV